MNVGVVGVGKLGLPCALAIESKGHSLLGYDIDPNISKYLESKSIPYKEEGAPELLQDTKMKMVSMKELVDHSDIIFVAVQTPHEAEYEGITRIPYKRVDFNYDYLVKSIISLSEVIDNQKDDKVVSIISTVLPGTISTYIKPLLSKKIMLVYNPFFIAMGTTIYDFLNPEFVLLGKSSKKAESLVKKFYSTIHKKKVISMSIESAELTKLSYNTIITSKINIANNIMEICHKIPGANVDDVMYALKSADKRIISPAYMDGGMGDGGGCHPRDGIALSWLARKLKMSKDIYDDMMGTRELQTNWLSELIISEKVKHPSLDIIILGKEFKPETNITIGSPSILLFNILKEKNYKVYIFDINTNFDTRSNKAIYFIGTKHKKYALYGFKEGSVVIDPFRYIRDMIGVEVIRIGE